MLSKDSLYGSFPHNSLSLSLSFFLSLKVCLFKVISNFCIPPLVLWNLIWPYLSLTDLKRLCVVHQNKTSTRWHCPWVIARTTSLPISPILFSVQHIYSSFVIYVKGKCETPFSFEDICLSAGECNCADIPCIMRNVTLQHVENKLYNVKCKLHLLACNTLCKLCDIPITKVSLK